MKKKKELYNKLKTNPKNIRFTGLCKVAELFSFRSKAVKGAICLCSSRY